MHKTPRRTSVMLIAALSLATSAYAAPAPTPPPPTPSAAEPYRPDPSRTADGGNGQGKMCACPCPDPNTPGWDGLAGGGVKGGHRLIIELDAWKERYFALTYLYGVTRALSLGVFASINLLEDTANTNRVEEGLVLGVPLVVSLLSTISHSARLGITPGFVHDASANSPHDRYTGFWLRIDGNFGFWVKRNTMLLGPAALFQLTTGRGLATGFGGDPVFRMPFMGGAFAEYHVTEWVAVAATLMAGAMYDRAASTTGQNLGFAYRTLLSLVFQTAP